MKFKDIEIGRYFIFLWEEKKEGTSLLRKISDTHLMNVPTGITLPIDYSVENMEIIEIYVV